MKVLFAVNNESISESIIKKYQQEYKEIISSKNVYYFDAITKELQKDKSYDRIVISEDVEPFANNNYGVIDKFIFERLDNISDEATSSSGRDIPIILICADRRSKSENILVKLFGIGIYSALLGQDRTITKVCELINKPRSKKEAKIYYRIDSEDVEYKAESEENVSEIEIQNILNHYKRLGKNEEEYVKSFDNIAEQYNDAQLRVICRFLPLNVKAVLEESSQKYQELVTFGTVTPSISQGKKEGKYVPNKEYQENKKRKKNESKLDIVEKNIGKSELTKPVIIPSVVGTKARKPTQEQKEDNEVKNVNNIEKKTTNDFTKIEEDNGSEIEKIDKNDVESILQSVESSIVEEKKRKRGRPKKDQIEEKEVEPPKKKKRGRPKKVQNEDKIEQTENINNDVEDDDMLDLFNLGNDEEDTNDGELILPGLEEEQSHSEESNVEDSNSQNIDLFNLANDEEKEPASDDYTLEKEENKSDYEEGFSQSSYVKNDDMYSNQIESTNKYKQEDDSSLKNLLSMSNKLVAFVGTSKNGTSFLVNNIADILSKNGIKTAILDLTQNKNSYYIYTKNDEELRKIAFNCIDNLKNGIAKGIEVNKNLTVFTSLPDRNLEFGDYKNILTTLNQNYSLIIMDCDYETNYAYFNFAQEIYLVQSFDILTIQPLTAFLRNLKARNILEPSKLRIVLNKALRVRSVSERMIIGGMSSYNDPSMSYMTELFNKDNVKYCTIPFDQEAYSRYLDGLINCEISTKRYPKNLMASLEKLANMVYPLLNNDRPANKFNTYNQNTNNFSSNMNETLNKMKNRY